MLRNNKSLIDRAVDTASDAVDAALPVLESAVTQMRELSKEAAEGAKDLAQDTATKAAPLIADGKVLAGEIAEATREVAIPKAKSAAAAGVAGAASLAASGKDLAAAKVAEAKGEPQKSRGSKLRKILVFGSLVALAGFVATKLRARQQSDNWQSSYTPPAPPSPPAPTARPTTSTTDAATGGVAGAAAAGGAHLAPGVGPDAPIATDDPMAALAGDEIGTPDDVAGATPGEAIADSVDEPRPVTTPDDPADVVDVEDQPTPKK